MGPFGNADCHQLLLTHCYMLLGKDNCRSMAIMRMVPLASYNAPAAHEVYAAHCLLGVNLSASLASTVCLELHWPVTTLLAGMQCMAFSCHTIRSLTTTFKYKCYVMLHNIIFMTHKQCGSRFADTKQTKNSSDYAHILDTNLSMPRP